MKRGYWIGKMIAFGIVMIALFGYLTMMLWNWLVPELFNGPVINFWQTMGLLVLSKIFLWTFGKHGHNGRGRAGWAPYWKEKWNTMSPDERERFKQKMKDKWCYKVPDSTEGK